MAVPVEIRLDQFWTFFDVLAAPVLLGFVRHRPQFFFTDIALLNLLLIFFVGLWLGQEGQLQLTVRAFVKTVYLLNLLVLNFVVDVHIY